MSSFRFLGVKIKDNSRRSKFFPSSQCDSHQQKLSIWMTRDREEVLFEKRIRIVIEWLQLNVRFITYLDLQSFEVVAFRNSICQVFVSEATPLSDVSRAPKSRDMSGNVPPDFAYLSEANFERKCASNVGCPRFRSSCTS